MQKILIVGEETRKEELLKVLDATQFEIEYSDGDEEEDFDLYDIIFDLNFDDDNENFPIYSALKNKIFFLSTAKTSLAETSYAFQCKVKSKIFGINALPGFLDSNFWELTAFRGNEIPEIEGFLKTIKKEVLWLEDRIGMFRPRTKFLELNEIAKCVDENIIFQNQSTAPIQNLLKEIDKHTITAIFETLASLFDDTKDTKYFPCQLLKKKYLRNQSFVKE